MRRWLKGLAGVALTLVLVVAITTAYGALAVPREHRASVTVHIEAPRARVFEVLTDVKRSDAHRPEVHRVEVLDARDDHLRWREHGEDGTLIFERVESKPPDRMVVAVASDDAAFGGRWIFELERTTRGTALTITEHGWIENPLFRVFAHHLGALDDTLRSYAGSVAARVESKAPDDADDDAP